MRPSCAQTSSMVQPWQPRALYSTLKRFLRACATVPVCQDDGSQGYLSAYNKFLFQNRSLAAQLRVLCRQKLVEMCLQIGTNEFGPQSEFRLQRPRLNLGSQAVDQVQDEVKGEKSREKGRKEGNFSTGSRGRVYCNCMAMQFS